MDLRPNEGEEYFLNSAYNFFYDLHDEILEDSFWEKDSYYRLSRIKDAFLIYSELLEYEPINWFLDALKKHRPPIEAEIAKDYFLFLRNVLIHFPVYKAWSDIWFDKKLINWSKPGRTIDKFLEKYTGHVEVKYRVWNSKKKAMTYLSIGFPSVYDYTNKVYLKDMLLEKEGMSFSLSLMRQVLESQIEEVKIQD